jgi:hypothetical protein
MIYDFEHGNAQRTECNVSVSTDIVSYKIYYENIFGELTSVGRVKRR